MRGRITAAVAMLVVTLVFSACAGRPYTLVEPRGARPIENFYTVDPGIAWTTWSAGKVEAWTIDGYLLHGLRFFKGIDEGEPLLRGGANEDKRPRFRASMTPAEMAEYVAESLFAGRGTPRNLRPAPFGTATGFRFEITYLLPDDVSRDAIVAGAMLNKRLHLIVYHGTSLYHFGKYRADAERVMDSVRLK